ncbi:MAG: RNA 2',3'-cyclic phosphodiesterase [Candidatus Hydrogenedentota bacterium]
MTAGDPEPIRAFLALDLPPEHREALFAVASRLKRAGARVSWVTPDRMHLTLRFLGEVTPDALERLGDDLTLVYARQEPFPLTLAHIGAFPNARAPRVIWAGLSPLEGPLAACQQAAETAARSIGLKAETKAFKPHVTLGRVRDPKTGGRLTEPLTDEQDFHGGEFEAGHVSLYASELTSSGPRYTQLRVFPFSWNS